MNLNVPGASNMLLFWIFSVGFILYIFAKIRYNKMVTVNTDIDEIKE